MTKNLFLFLSAVLGAALTARAADDLPRSWIDPDTGHRIVQLSTEPGSACLYFTQYSYTAGGTKLLMTTPHGIDLVTLATGEIEHVYEGRTDRVIQTGRKTGAIFYTKEGSVYALDPATKQSRLLVKLPAHCSVATVNADETMVAGSISESDRRPDLAPKLPPPPAAGYKPGETQLGHDNYPDKAAMMRRRLAARLPITMVTVNLQTGEVKQLLRSTDWLNHFQFSPTDPTLLMFCHEGAWWDVDRLWLMRVAGGAPLVGAAAGTDGRSEPMLIQSRTMAMETAGHEFWSNDGQWIYYDHKMPNAEVFWVGGYNPTTGERVQYHVERDQWSVHYNNSPDGTLFSGDGGAETNAAHAKDGKWIYLFHPELITHTELAPNILPPPKQDKLIQAGTFHYERLVNLAKHDYSLEPNGNFTPDGKWIVFRSNLRGPIQVYAVEVAKSHLPLAAAP
jgi:oligogalacturonide lyase